MEQKDWEWVLASASPRRHDILLEGGIVHEVRPSQIDESVFEKIEPRLMVQLLAASKAAAANAGKEEWILGADTVVVLDGQVLGKPRDAHHAVDMLTMLSGKTHFVYMGIALIAGADGRMKTSCEETRVTFRTLSQKEIEDYVATGEPMDKAGAYGIQGAGGALVEKTQGDFQNVVGLPLEAVKRLFAELCRKENENVKFL